jgi:Tfp pilus assembly protein PilO
MNLNEVLIKLSSLSRSMLVIASLGTTFFFYSFLYDDGTSLESNILTAKNDLQVEREKEKESDLALKEVEKVKGALEALTQQFNVVSSQLPRDFNMAEVIRIVDNVATKSELTIRGKEPKSLSKDKFIEMLPIQISADGHFNQVIQFLYYITAIERIFRVQSLNIRSEGDFQSKNTLIKIRMDLSSYRFVSEEVSKKGSSQ